MAGQTFLYDGDGYAVLNRSFAITTGNPVILRAGNLTTEVPIYTHVGNCAHCEDDVVWEQMVLCGEPVVLGPDSPILAIETPGHYFFGDPDVEDLALGATVNVTIERVKSIPVELQKVCSGASGPITIDSSCAAPLYVQICPDPSPAPQVEISDVALGCAVDAGGDPIGVVVLSRTVDEETGTETRVLVAYLYDGSTVNPYTGAFGPCETPCAELPARGLQPSWT